MNSPLPQSQPPDSVWYGWILKLFHHWKVGERQVTYVWAVLVGMVGSCMSLFFEWMVEVIQWMLTGIWSDSRVGTFSLVEPEWRMFIPVAGGLVAGCITATGLASKLITVIVNVSGGHKMIALVLTMLCCIVLGMGVPTTANYCIMAATCAPILMNPQTWVASGHLSGFSDPLMDCRECHERFRADKVIEDWCAQNGFELPRPIDAFTQAEMKDFVEEHNIPCPTCGKHNFTDIRQFNLMFKTFQGVTEDAKNTVYLRPETAQGIFVNFVNVQRTTRRKLPFGIGQIGKSFRNEITPGNFIFRVREFEQMELEFFCQPNTDLEWFQYWRNFCHQWLLSLGMKDENLRLRDHDPEELCFYSKATTDFEFMFPFGWGELWGVADRTDYDLTQHQNTSGKDLTYFDQEKIEHYIPYFF